MTARKITLRYQGRCRKCHRKIPAGTQAYWESDNGVWHVECDYGKNRGLGSPTRSSFKMPEMRTSLEREEVAIPFVVFGLELSLLTLGIMNGKFTDIMVVVMFAHMILWVATAGTVSWDSVRRGYMRRHNPMLFRKLETSGTLFTLFLLVLIAITYAGLTVFRLK